MEIGQDSPPRRSGMNELHVSLRSDEKLSLNWEYLSAISSGTSPIDLEFLALRNMRDACAFADEYGMNPAFPAARDQIAKAHHEAIDFIVSKFLGHEADWIPHEVRAPEDPLQLLIFASQRGMPNDLLRAWSCAVLKVMHAIFYIDNNIKLRYFGQIREQVFSGFNRLLAQDGAGFTLTDGCISLPLVHLDRKNNKERDSILLKLLQKAEYVAADIHDHLGLRLVFNTRFECLLALCLLQRAHLISAVNVDSQRTRNTLLDLNAAKLVFTKYRSVLTRHADHPSEVIAEIERELQEASEPQSLKDNPHSAAGFNSLQVTVRKMIRIPSGSASSDGQADDEASPSVPLAPGEGARSTAFFFEYEIQLMDRLSYERSQHGAASHEAYKQRQIETARLRVLGRHLVRRLEGRHQSEA